VVGRGTSTTFLIEELTTDDGLLLSGTQLLEARSNWVRDLLTTGRSVLLQRISGRLGFVGTWATILALVFLYSPQEWHVQDRLALPAWPHELVGGFLSILLVFRTDQAYQRFWEGRKRWAEVAGDLSCLEARQGACLGADLRVRRC
jgi:ion channel-forming bestrophin family protein